MTGLAGKVALITGASRGIGRAITVNAVIPTATDGAGYFSAADDADALRSALQAASPIGSRMGSVDDVADAVEFFVGDLAR